MKRVYYTIAAWSIFAMSLFPIFLPLLGIPITLDWVLGGIILLFISWRIRKRRQYIFGNPNASVYKLRKNESDN